MINNNSDLILTTDTGATTLSFRPKPPPKKKNSNELPNVKNNLNMSSPSRLRTSSESPKRILISPKFCKMPIIQPKMPPNKVSNPKVPIKHQVDPPLPPIPKRSYTVSHGSVSDKPNKDIQDIYNPIQKEDAEDDLVQQQIYGLKYKKGRKLIKQGSVHIEIYKTDNLIYHDNDIELFMFDDMFVLGRKSFTKNFIFYESVEYFSIEINDQANSSLSFELIQSGNKRFKFILKSEDEKERWFNLFKDQLSSSQKSSLPLKTNIFGKKLGYVTENSTSVPSPQESSSESNVIEIPPWDPDDSATSCYSCDSKFTSINRRHHCRNCGHVYILLSLLLSYLILTLFLFKIFCKNCTMKRAFIPRYGFIKKKVLIKFILNN